MSRAIRHAFDVLELLNRHESLRVSEIARSLDLPRLTAMRAIDAACQELRWPLTLVLLQGLSLRVAHTTDALTPHKLFTSSAGIQLPLRDTASGLVYLAYCDADTRRMLLEAAAQDPPNRRFPRIEAELAPRLKALAAQIVGAAGPA